jgi:hypothetical protein
VIPEVPFRWFVDGKLEIGREIRKLRNVRRRRRQIVVIRGIDVRQCPHQIADVGAESEIVKMPDVDNDSEGHAPSTHQAGTAVCFQL